MDRISLVSKVEKNWFIFYKKMRKSKRLTAGLLKKKPTWSFIQTIFITTFALRVLLRDGINHGNKRLHWKGTEGGGGSRRKIKEFVMSSFAWSRFVSAFVPLFFCSVVLFFRSFVRYVCHIHIQPSRHALDHYFVSLFTCLSLSNQFFR